MANPRNFGWKSHKLADHSFVVLESMLSDVQASHQNPRENGRCIENGKPTIFIYDEKGRKKMDAITWAVYHKQQRGDVA